MAAEIELVELLHLETRSRKGDAEEIDDLCYDKESGRLVVAQYDSPRPSGKAKSHYSSITPLDSYLASHPGHRQRVVDYLKNPPASLKPLLESIHDQVDQILKV